jgi:hypothetical protein
MSACFLAADCGFVSKDIRVADQIRSVTIGDFTGDSRPDIAVRTLADVSVLVNMGAGNFSPPVKTALPFGSALASVTDFGVGRTEITADFNGDSKLDLAVKDRNEILLSVGDGTFLPPQPIGGGYPTFYGLTTTGDFNGDHKPDLVFFVRGSLAILLGAGDGTFRVGSTAELDGDGQLLVADFNLDGWSDLAHLRYRNRSSNYNPDYDPNCCELRLAMGQSDGNFQAPVTIATAGPGGILAGDFNDDGKPDLATIDGVLLGNGDGSFQAPRHFFDKPSFDYWYAIPAGPAAAADLNGDARVDLVYFGSTEGRTIFGLLGNGDGTLSPLSPSSYWLNVWETEDRRVGGSADLDGDGRPDLVTAVYCDRSQQRFNCSGGTLTVLLNRLEVSR